MDAFRPEWRGFPRSERAQRNEAQDMCVSTSSRQTREMSNLVQRGERKLAGTEPVDRERKGNVLGAVGLRYGSLSWVDYFQFRKLGSKRQDGQ